MTEPDDALLWARKWWAARSERLGLASLSQVYLRGDRDAHIADEAEAYRAGVMAEALRAQALVNFAVAMEEHDDNEVCDAASDALDTYWGRP